MIIKRKPDAVKTHQSGEAFCQAIEGVSFSLARLMPPAGFRGAAG
jgi:hypothetical protein